jgi:signal transduction histidine kinase
VKTSLFDGRLLRAATLSATIALAVSAAAFVWLDARVDRILDREVASAVAQETAMLDTIDREEGREALERAIDTRLRVADARQVLLLVDARGRRIAGNLPEVPARTGDGDDAWGLYQLADGRRLRATIATLNADSRLLVGEFGDGHGDVGRSILVAATLAMLVTLAIGFGAAWRFNRYVLDRIGALAVTARQIMRGQMTARAPEGRHVDAFGELSRVFNEMLDQSEALITGMRTVTDSLAHDLRTPLTRMHASIAAAREVDDSGQRDELLAVAEAEAEHALQTFTALIDLARAEAGLSRESMEPVALDALATDVVELFEPLADSQRQRLTFAAAPIRALAHRQILFQALGNLLENAIKDTPPGSLIALELERDGRLAQFCITDSGAGIPSEALEQVTRPFVRLENARGTPGSGLGLAIAAAAAKLHGGTLALESIDGGFRVRLTLVALD